MVNQKVIETAIRTIKAKLDEALTKEKETEGTEDTIIWHMVANDYKLAISVLEKQMVKKPNKRELGSSLIRRVYHCPNCNKRLYDCAIKNGELDHVSPGSRKNKFCEDCGQAIDWSE